MSYDLEIGTHERPTRAQIESWATEQGLTVEPNGDDSLVVSRPAKRGDGYLFEVGGPHAAEPEDFADEIAAACLLPRWTMSVLVPYSVPKRAIELGRALARHLAAANDGAAFDPQEDGLIWPRGVPKRVPPRHEEELTSLVSLKWYLPPARWARAPETLVRVLGRRCPEALPSRYGRFEPPQHRFEADDVTPFVSFVLDAEEGHGFWFARRPSFGGSWAAPHADEHVRPDDERLRIAHLGVDFDGRVLEQDQRWREAVVDLFATLAAELGAFFGAVQVEPGWTVTRNNRLHGGIEHMEHKSEHILRGLLWQGLPPVPMWVSWFGAPYRDLVAPRLGNADEVDHRDEGILLRLAAEPRHVGELPQCPLPAELTYRHRPTEVGEDSSMTWVPAQPGDEAAEIPPIGP